MLACGISVANRLTIGWQLTTAMREDLWIFGYGSLLWDPGFHFAERVPAGLAGWHRRFSLRSLMSWGSHETPGVAAALHRGGRTLGAAFRIAQPDVEETLAYLAVRENDYAQATVRLRLRDGRAIAGLTYVVDPANPLFFLEHDEPEIVRLIRTGAGRKGSSRFYLESTVRELESLGSRRTSAHALLARVRADDEVR